MRAIGITDFLNKNFNVYPFKDKFFNAFGEPETNFSALIYGHPKNGKTEFCIQLAKYMSQFARVYYNSFEQGISKSLQDALVRNNMEEVTGRVIFGNKETYTEMTERLSKRNSPMICFIDSRDYMNLTASQWFRLIEKFPRKSFILISWESAGKPASKYARDISYRTDVIVHVRDFIAYPRSRFGGNQKFVIWNRKPQVGEQLTLIESK